MAKNKQQQDELIQLFGVYNVRLGKLYAKFVKELAKLGFDIDSLEDNPLFNFDNFPELRDRLNEIFFDFVQKNVLVLQDGIRAGTALAFSQDASNLKGYTILNDDAILRVRANVMRSFLNYRMGSTHGLSLSDKVWNYAQQTKSEFEMAISNVITDGLSKGTSAEELSRRVRMQLNDPDMMYRRYHLKVIQSDGSKKDVAKWYRRIIDEDGKVHFVQAPLEEVGTGTYRSARKNAVRLMRTEINASYHNANTERWRLEPFVLGIRIWGSPEHPRKDICDDLWGDYPKEIDFAGFHPQCLCASAPILCSKEELNEIIKRKQNGEDISKYVSPNRIKDIPDNFKKYIEEHHDSIRGQFERGTANWFFRDNTKFFAHLFSEDERDLMGISLPPAPKQKRVKTEAEKALIQKRWDERRKKNALTLKTYENVLKVAAQYPEVDTSLLEQLAGKYDLVQLGLETKNVAHQIVAIRKQHQFIKKVAGNVLSVANNYSEINTANILSLYQAKNYAALNVEVKAVAKQIAALNKQAKAMSDVIPDAKNWLGQFSLQELKEVRQSVLDNIAKWTNKYNTDTYLKSKYATLEDYLIYKIGDEAKYVVDSTYLKPHTLHKTSAVAEAAYKKQISTIQHGVEMKAVAADIADIKAWSVAHPQSKNVAKMLKEAESLYAADNNMTALKQKVDEAQKEIEKREKEQARRDRKRGKVTGTASGDLWAGGKAPFTQAELDKLADYEKRIIDGIFAGKGADDSLISQYHDYVLQISEKYYDKQLSVFTAAEQKKLKAIVKKYLARPNENPHYIWGATLGGKYDDRGYFSKIKSYLSKGIVKGLTAEEISIVQRFTNGSTFSNCYNLRHDSPYWRQKFKDKLRSYTNNLKEVKHQYEIIEEWSQGANYVLDQMVRYNGVTFRGLDGGGGPELRAAISKAYKTGQPWVNNASCSTSMKHSVARGFDDDLIIILHNKTGAYIHAVSEYSSEYEIMTLRGTKYKVLRPPVKIGSRYYCELQEI